jgi:hypothetical protein
MPSRNIADGHRQPAVAIIQVPQLQEDPQRLFPVQAIK